MAPKILYLNEPNSASYIIKLISIILFAIFIFVVLLFERPKKNSNGSTNDKNENLFSKLYTGGLLTLLSFVITFLYSTSSTTAVIVKVFFSLIIIFSTLLSLFVLLKSKIEPPKEKPSSKNQDKPSSIPSYKIIETKTRDKYGNISTKKVYQPIVKEKTEKKSEKKEENNLSFFQILINSLIDSKNIILLIVYIIGLITIYSITPTKYINKYSFVIFPITLFLGFALFFINVYQENRELKKTENLNSQITNYSLIYICLIIFITIFGVVDPGNYIKNNSGIFIFATVLSIIFGLLYLLTFLLPVFNIVKNSPLTSSFSSSFFLIFKVILFLGLLITIIVGLVNYPGGFMDEKNIKTTVINILLFLSLLNVVILLLRNIFSSSLISNSLKTEKSIDDTIININNAFKKLLLLVFGFLILRIIIYILVRIPSYIKNKASLGSMLFLFFIFIIIVAGIFLTLKKIYANSPVANKINNSIFSLFSLFVTAFKDLINTPKNYFIVLIVLILCYIIYFATIPYLQKKFEKQGGVLLIERPIYLNNETILGTYNSLNYNDTSQTSSQTGSQTSSQTSSQTKDSTSLQNINYNYAISFWIFLDAFGPSMNSSYAKYTSLLNYGGNPNIKYNAQENTLIITMKKNGNMMKRGTYNFSQSQEEEVIYKRENVLLQKWTNIIINYNGGNLDIFIDGELVKSQGEIVPYMNTDTLIVGTNNGLNSGICNLVYFSKNLNSTQIYNLYNYAKNKDPPLIFDSSKTIISQIS